MRRPIAPCACLLALITGAWFGQAYTLLAPLDPMASPEIVDNRATDAEFAVRAFYDGVKHFFATGDAAGIREVVAENFVDQVRLPVSDSGREGFVRHLGAVRRAFPGLQIEPAEIAGQGDTVAVRIEVSAGTAAPFLGMPVTGFRPWGSVEVFRVVAGQIVARWGEPGGYGLFEPIATEVFAGLDMADARPTLTRRSYEPGASDWDAPSWGPVLMIAESGTVIVDVDAIVVATVRRAADAVDGDPTTIFPVKTPTPVALAPGDVLTVAEPAKVEIRNESEAPAAVLVLTLRAPPSIPQLGSSQAALPLGVRTSALTADIIGPTTTAGTVAVSVGRAFLAPGMGLAPHPVSGYELTLVERGTLTLQVDGDRPSVRQPNGRATTIARTSEVAAGLGLTVPAGAVASYRNDASMPLALLLVNVYVTAPAQGP